MVSEKCFNCWRSVILVSGRFGSGFGSIRFGPHPLIFVSPKETRTNVRGLILYPGCVAGVGGPSELLISVSEVDSKKCITFPSFFFSFLNMVGRDIEDLGL